MEYKEEFCKATLIINENHSLSENQKELLKIFDKIEYLKVPSAGWTAEEQMAVCRKLWLSDRNTAIVFVSPIPYLLAQIASDVNTRCYSLYVFHNDNREKKELPNGQIIFSIPKTGWKLLRAGNLKPLDIEIEKRRSVYEKEEEKEIDAIEEMVDYDVENDVELQKIGENEWISLDGMWSITPNGVYLNEGNNSTLLPDSFNLPDSVQAKYDEIRRK